MHGAQEQNENYMQKEGKQPERVWWRRRPNNSVVTCMHENAILKLFDVLTHTIKLKRN